MVEPKLQPTLADREAADEFIRSCDLSTLNRYEQHTAEFLARHRINALEALSAENAKLAAVADTLRKSRSFSAGHGPTGEFVTLTFNSRKDREAFLDAHIAALKEPRS